MSMCVCVCFVNQTSPPTPTPLLPPALLLGGMCGPPPTMDGCANIPDKHTQKKERKWERGKKDEGTEKESTNVGLK